ncbi:MAG: serine protease [Oligoflexia bacterium]|nr:serine protease [Oligoflexia bacterium]
MKIFNGLALRVGVFGFGLFVAAAAVATGAPGFLGLARGAERGLAAEWPIQLGGRNGPAPVLPSGSNAYQLGDEWGKKPVSEADLRDPVFARAAMATARVGGGTGFYLGVFGGSHVVATNHHVCPSVRACVGSVVSFPLLKLRFKVTRSLGSWPQIDLSLLLIEVPKAEDAQTLGQVAANFDFDSPITAGQELLTVGFGSYDNPRSQLMGNQDHDCKVFSGENEFRLLADPDDYNPGPYRAWSFANGCDVSHGDSGSAIVDRKTGRPIGILWTGRIPKSSRVQSSAYLDQLLQAPTEEIWTELSYSVPAAKAREVLELLIGEGKIPGAEAAIVREVIAGPAEN